MDKRIMASIVGVLLVGIVLGYFAVQPEIRNLQNEVIQRDTLIQTLQNEVNSLSEEATQKDSEIQLLQQQIDNLNKSYGALLFRYNLINSPASNSTLIGDLQITLTTHHTIFYHEDPLSGNVTVTYLNGTTFEGEFSLGIHRIGSDVELHTAHFKIRNGFAEFTRESYSAFKYGPGTYRIRIINIFTIDGVLVAEDLPEVFVEVV